MLKMFFHFPKRNPVLFLSHRYAIRESGSLPLCMRAKTAKVNTLKLPDFFTHGCIVKKYGNDALPAVQCPPKL